MKVTVVLEDDSGRRFEGQAVLKGRGRRAKAHSDQGATGPVAESAPRKPKQALARLHVSGFFKVERKFKEIEIELSKLQCNFPKPTLMMALGSTRFLTRKGLRGNFGWVQKFAPGV